MKNFLHLMVLLSVLCLTVACTPSAPEGKVRVTGVVTVGGAPLSILPPATGILNFAGISGSDSGTAPIGKDGGFAVVLSPGPYAVSILAKNGADTMNEQGAPVPARSLVPEKYGSTETSGLEVTVDAKGTPLAIAVE